MTTQRVIIVSSPTKLQTVSFSHVFVGRPSEGVTDLSRRDGVREQLFRLTDGISLFAFRIFRLSFRVDVKGFCA